MASFSSNCIILHSGGSTSGGQDKNSSGVHGPREGKSVGFFILTGNKKCKPNVFLKGSNQNQVKV